MEEKQDGLLQFQSGLQMTVNKTYSYNNQTNLFTALVPTYLKDYAQRYVLPSCQWVDGYVPTFHNDGSGIVSTRIATALISGMAKQVVGEKPIFKHSSSVCEEEGDHVSFVTKLSKEGNFRQAMYGAVAFAMTTGTSLIKLNKTIYGEPWWEAVRLDNCFFSSDFRGRVQEAYFYIRNYADTRPNHSGESFYIVERRFYMNAKQVGLLYDEDTKRYLAKWKKGDRVPMVVYNVYRTKGGVLNKSDSARTLQEGLNWEELPKWFQEIIIKDYASIKLGIPQMLPFNDIGVEICKDGETDISVPTAQCFGKSKVLDVQSDLINYEIGNAYRLRDAYLGKGTLYLPKSMTLGDIAKPDIARNGILSAMPDTPVELMRGMDTESQQAIVKQFELRITDWQRMMDDALKAIATKWGTTPKALSSYLAHGEAQQTATQIDSEDDMSIAFINQERSYFIEPFNRLLKTTLAFCGKPNDVEVGFGNPSLVNKDRILARTEKEYAMGLIDIEEAVRQTNPDLEEDALQAKIKKALKRQEELGAQLDFGDFDSKASGEGLFDDKPRNNLKDGADADELFKDNEADLGGNNLRGSTNPTQKQGKRLF